MENRFVLPLVAVAETMRTSPEVVVLQARLSSLPGISKQACLAQVIVGQGRIHSCTISTLTGTLLREQKEAYHVLEQQGDLEWTLLPHPSAHVTSHPGPIPCLRLPLVARSHWSQNCHPIDARSLLMMELLRFAADHRRGSAYGSPPLLGENGR
jgi:hypothetical protein